MTRARVVALIKANPVSGTVWEMRAAFEKLTDQDVAGQPFERGNLAGHYFGDGPDAIWLHGGGYVFGSSRSHAACAAYLARAAGMRVWVPDYPLAPEAIWPAQLKSVKVFAESFDAPVHVIGDSAGGHLALNFALEVPQHVQSLVLMSPNTDRSGQSETRQANSPHDLMNDDRDDAALARMAMPDLSDTSVAASPLHADLGKLPPVWITASTSEVLLDDTLLLIRSLGRAGVPVSSRIVRGLFHLWILWPNELDQARESLESAARFLRRAQGKKHKSSQC